MNKQLVIDLLTEFAKSESGMVGPELEEPLDTFNYEPKDDECVLCTTGGAPGIYVDTWSSDLCSEHSHLTYWLDDGSAPSYWSYIHTQNPELIEQLKQLAEKPSDVEIHGDVIWISSFPGYQDPDISRIHWDPDQEPAPADAAYVLAHRFGVKYWFAAM